MHTLTLRTFVSPAQDGDGLTEGGDDDEWELVDTVAAAAASDVVLPSGKDVRRSLVGVTSADIEAAQKKALEAQSGEASADAAPAYDGPRPGATQRSPFQPMSVVTRYWREDGADFAAPPPYSHDGVDGSAVVGGGAWPTPVVLTRETDLSTLTDTELDEALATRGVDRAMFAEGTPRPFREGLLYPLLPEGPTLVAHPEPSAPVAGDAGGVGGGDGTSDAGGDGGLVAQEADASGSVDDDDDDDDSPPYEFCCPVTQELLQDPVICADGFTYERSAIVQWLSSNRTSPMTGAVLPHTHVIPNVSLRVIIADATTRHPSWTAPRT